ncbi:hypothetical protein A1O7_00404 [Cladophialophora yegresii CBS 114405]|uniref:Uncharacterized protein n=1 Tax=Cladophialophora yegresii CBS 114405 TaxID=1182544 RepID=W9W7Y0_9EURO|nr:uncharacterized protein A1O7_00404 [Cladophialophora yegresii CBS 114405]EXJ64068.1 hypothetical protein A1O7_00404 [Cladophialophora yegresii CBS 114405]
MHFSGCIAVLLLPLLKLACLVNCLPSPTGSSESGQSCANTTDTFDEAGIVLVPQLTPVGMYHGHTYSGFGTSSESLLLGTVNGVTPKSSPNVASSTIVNDLIQAGQLTLQPFGNITASPSKYFDIYSGWLACVLMNGIPQAPAVPSGCTVTVTGVGKDNNVVPAYTVSFSPTNLLATSMVFFQLPDTFRNLISVTFGIATSTVSPELTVLLLDNLSVCSYS